MDSLIYFVEKPLLFNSLDFVLFFPFVVVLYFTTPHRHRWALLLVASYYFYGSSKPEYVLLLAASTLIDFLAALAMSRHDERKQRRPWLYFSLAGNLGMLFTFKYADFANENLRQLFGYFDLSYDIPAFGLLLPIGISFYTFQSLSYTIDVYRGKREPERHLGIFALYVSFFPQLVAGPIERAGNLLPQLRQQHLFDWQKVRSGLLIMLWGLFMKLVIADRLAIYVDTVYAAPANYPGLPLWIATYMFMYQIFCDFAGYSLVAIGAARVMGIQLSTNFRRPYAARTISDIWRRWHITLTTWIYDYVFRPLESHAHSRTEVLGKLLLTWLLFGLWHGAAWHYVLFGLFAGAMLALAHLTKTWRQRLTRRIFSGTATSRRLHAVLQVGVVFHYFFVCGIFFRANSTQDISTVFSGMLQLAKTPDNSLFIAPTMRAWELTLALAAILVLEAVQWLQEHRQAQLSSVMKHTPLRWCVYLALIFSLLMFGEMGAEPFIYFQF